MHQIGGSITTYVEFTKDNLIITTKGIRYKYNQYWHLIDENTEFVYA